MPDKTVTTTQGVAWDQIAKEHMGSEMAMHTLIAANLDKQGLLAFSGNVALVIPETETAQAVQSLPPWKEQP